MSIRIITTDSSVWTLDFEQMQFRRDPRVEGAEHPLVTYSGEWRDFYELAETQAYGYESERILFSVRGDDVDGAGARYITSTYKPAEQGR